MKMTHQMTLEIPSSVSLYSDSSTIHFTFNSEADLSALGAIKQDRRLQLVHDLIKQYELIQANIEQEKDVFEAINCLIADDDSYQTLLRWLQGEIDFDETKKML
jgi:hypothetical protein